MSYVKQCDRCGKIYSNPPELKPQENTPITKRDAATEVEIVRKTLKNVPIHLCEGCVNKFVSWVYCAPKEDLEKEALERVRELKFSRTEKIVLVVLFIAALALAIRLQFLYA